MASPRTKALILATASAAFLTAGAALLQVEHARAMAALGDRVPVAVAARPLSAGQPLRAGDLALRSTPAACAFSERVADPAAVLGHTLAVAVPQGAPVPTYALRPPPALHPGERAWEIRASERILLDSQIQPGDRADVLAAVGREGQGTVREVAAGVRVLAVDRSSRPDAVTLGVTPDQARELMTAENFARQVRVVRAPSPKE